MSLPYLCTMVVNEYLYIKMHSHIENKTDISSHDILIDLCREQLYLLDYRKCSKLITNEFSESTDEILYFWKF